MSVRAAYVGDEVSAAAFRLAGVEALVPNAGDEATALASALAKASLVLLAASVAARLPERTLRNAQAALHPLLLVVPDLAGGMAMPDIVRRLRVQLGLEA